MKSTISILLLSLIMISGFAQNLYYSVHGNYKHPITKEKLSKARTMGDIIPYYPASWISKYNSVEISAINNVNTVTTTSSNDIFSEEQIKLLSSPDPGTEVIINIVYQHENSLTRKTEESTMNYSVTVVPEVEAVYPDGYEQLSLYIKENAIDKISSEDSKELHYAAVSFTINEEGGITDVQISKTSGNQEVDKLLMDVVNNMPKWSPAQDSKGQKVRQEFEFTVSGNEGC